MFTRPAKSSFANRFIPHQAWAIPICRPYGARYGEEKIESNDNVSVSGWPMGTFSILTGLARMS